MSALRTERNNLREALRGMVNWHSDCKCHGCTFGQSTLKDSGTESHEGCEKVSALVKNVKPIKKHFMVMQGCDRVLNRGMCLPYDQHPDGKMFENPRGFIMDFDTATEAQAFMERLKDPLPPLVLMDHVAGIDQDYTFEKFAENLRKWLKPGQWINVQLSNGSPSPTMNLSLIVKAEDDSKKVVKSLHGTLDFVDEGCTKGSDCPCYQDGWDNANEYEEEE
jgi:hypothetical protein